MIRTNPKRALKFSYLLSGLVKVTLTSVMTVLMINLIIGCAPPAMQMLTPPPITPSSQPTSVLQLQQDEIKPMYRELLPVDLPTVVRVVMARNIDIQQARQRVEASLGRYESNVQSLLPVIVPSFLFQHVDGVNLNASGTLAFTNFNSIFPSISAQWILNPGKVMYDIVASRRRLEAAGQQEYAVKLDALRQAGNQYFELVLAQAHVSAARQAATEATEALRLTKIRAQAGTVLAADETRAKAVAAGRKQDLLIAINSFYQASLALCSTLQLDPVVTLVPGPEQISQTTLVTESLTIESLLSLALKFRPDLQSARTLLSSVDADKGAVAWGGLGPQLQASGTIGALGSEVNGHGFRPHETERAAASAGFSLGLSTFGQIKVANANLRSAVLDVEQKMEQVRVQVVSAQQNSQTHAALIPLAREQVESAQEALRLAESNLKAGTMLLLDILQADDQLNVARLRYATAVVRYNQSQVNLLSAIGLINPETLFPNMKPATTQPKDN